MTVFGTTKDGQDVHAITIGNDRLSVKILTWGAVLQDVRLTRVPYGLTLNSANLSDYQGGMHHFGSLIGPVANRLTNATAPIGGVAHQFEANFNGRHSLHSGSAATHLKVWQIDNSDDFSCILSLNLPDGEGEFPGNRKITARFEVLETTLRLTVTATTDAPTLINMANHSYWNLDGSDTWDGHRLRIAADHYLPTDDEFIPTGEIVDVTGTSFDFRKARRISPQHPAFDNNFCLSDTTVAPRDVLTLAGQSGVEMTVATNQPGIQVFDARNAQRPNRAPYEGLAIEAQGWPDAPNHAGFPSIELHPDQTYEQVTSWRFSAP